MDDLKFDIYAMVKPKTEADILALLAEARSELQRVNAHFKALHDSLKPR
jgi:hypothetical protein